ncbi:calpain-1 catalytic subunit-like isoform X2 [Takifugu flavidus]|uniref:calpain-1 catalytic subunit-like isoform X2 n=1 Tax=Takifugu flavidus TaxID=433684 RepID=UPI00254404D8|nr:calpain-1 catalytic subunit-like isoform X2 [Takifugu flavidus]
MLEFIQHFIYASLLSSPNVATMPPPGVCLNILEARSKQNGHGGSKNPEKFLQQDYEQLKQYCNIRGLRYIDERFPPDRNSIGAGILSPSDLDRVVWLRPAKIPNVANPCLIIDGISRFDFGQGILGDCWFLASLGSLTFQSDILKQVVPVEQTFQESYCGLFHFRFWRFGGWVDVVIDDKLPTINGRLIFVHSKDPNEFWPALLEKAYAKVCGSYADMNAGSPAEALMDFTGGVHVTVQLSDPPQNLWELIFRAGQSKSLMSSGTLQGETPANTVLLNGLVEGHAYTITGVKEMLHQGKVVRLVRLWNPWGKGEWKGDWSDGSPLWRTVSAEDRKLCLSVAEDGEFWMPFKDFCSFFTDLDICCLCPSFLDGEQPCKWRTSMFEGRWVSGVTAGGCMNYKDTFWINPQFRLKLHGDFSENANDKNIFVSVTQKPDKRRRQKCRKFHIGFSVFEIPEEDEAHRGKFPAAFFKSRTPVAQSKKFLDAREVMEVFRLKPAEYLIVPSTFGPNETASFLLTIVYKGEAHGYETSTLGQPEAAEDMTEIKANTEDDERKTSFFRQHSDQYEEVNAEQLQRLLNDQILKGDLKSGGFSIDACCSMVALMDNSITGKLNSEEFVALWKNVIKYRDIFYLTDVSQTGTLSLSELRNAFNASGKRLSDDMLSLMVVRYGSAGHMSLESFISLILRLDCMHKIFKNLSDGTWMNLREPEWIYLSMYT